MICLFCLQLKLFWMYSWILSPYGFVWVESCPPHPHPHTNFSQLKTVLNRLSQAQGCGNLWIIEVLKLIKSTKILFLCNLTFQSIWSIRFDRLKPRQIYKIQLCFLVITLKLWARKINVAKSFERQSITYKRHQSICRFFSLEWFQQTVEFRN